MKKLSVTTSIFALPLKGSAEKRDRLESLKIVLYLAV